MCHLAFGDGCSITAFAWIMARQQDSGVGRGFENALRSNLGRLTIRRGYRIFIRAEFAAIPKGNYVE